MAHTRRPRLSPSGPFLDEQLGTILAMANDQYIVAPGTPQALTLQFVVGPELVIQSPTLNSTVPPAPHAFLFLINASLIADEDAVGSAIARIRFTNTPEGGVETELFTYNVCVPPCSSAYYAPVVHPFSQYFILPGNDARLADASLDNTFCVSFARSADEAVSIVSPIQLLGFVIGGNPNGVVEATQL
jgi:hypothetical protein